MKYQILSVTLKYGNAVFLPHGMEIAADSMGEVGAKVSENLLQLGLHVSAVSAIHKADVTEQWEPQPEKPNLFNDNGKDEEVLPRTASPKSARPKRVLAITDQRSKKADQKGKGA